MLQFLKNWLKMFDHHKTMAIDLADSQRLALAHERAQQYSAHMARFHRGEIKRLKGLQLQAQQQQQQELEATQTNFRMLRVNS